MIQLELIVESNVVDPDPLTVLRAALVPLLKLRIRKDRNLLQIWIGNYQYHLGFRYGFKSGSEKQRAEINRNVHNFYVITYFAYSQKAFENINAIIQFHHVFQCLTRH